jgi:phosphatidate cytidylyltransferase
MLRVLTGVALVPLLAVFYWAPPWTALLLLAGGAALAFQEICRLLEAAGLRPLRVTGTLLVLGLVAAFSLADWGVAMVLALAITALPAACMLRKLPIDKALGSLAGTLYAVVMAGVFMGFQMAIRLEGREEGYRTGAALLVFLYATVFLGDVMALYTGKLIGRHAMAPRISPKKTWEGFAGNLLGNQAGAFLAAPLLPDAIGWVHVPVLALLLGLTAVLGDLTVSMLKRSVGVKDMGSLLPGHGGILDRLDSLILSAPVLFYYVKYVAGL